MTTLSLFMDRAHRPFLFRFRSVLCLGWLSLFVAAQGELWTHLAQCAEAAQQPAVPSQPGAGRAPKPDEVEIRAQVQEKEKDTYHMRGHVEVTYQEMKLTADEATYNLTSQEVAARGHVTFTDPDAHLEADEAHYNFRTSQGRFLNGHGAIRTAARLRPRLLMTDQFYLRARELDRLDPDTFTLKGARLSSCECESKGWSIGAESARVKLDDKVVSHGAVFRLLRVPLFYSPLLINSVSHRQRQTGFLLPHIGNSSQKGVIVGDGFYWAINPSADLLLGVENFSVRGPAATARFRAEPSATSDIGIEFFGVHDRGGGPQRALRAPGQGLRATGQANDLGHGFRGVLDVDYISSLTFRQTFTDNFTQAVASEARQRGFVSKNFDAYSFNIHVSRYQNFLCAQPVPGNPGPGQNPNCPSGSNPSRDVVSIRETPSLSFSGMDKQVGRSPLYFSFETSAAGVGRAEPGFQTPRLAERVDLSPEVTLRSKPLWGFHLTPSATLHATHYGSTLVPGRDSLNRILGELSVDLRPPSFDKTLARPLHGYRVKHVIEPDVRYRLVRSPEARDLTEIVRFDETDILAETNEFEYSLTSSLLVRKDVADGAGEKPPARELLSWRLSQEYYFDPTFGGALEPGRRVVFDPTISLTGFAFAQGRRLSPVVSVLKFAPYSNYDTEVRVDFSPGGGDVLNAGLTSHVRRGPIGLAATDFFINRTAALPTPLVPSGALSQLPSFNLLRVVATYGEVSRKGFSSALGLDYNFAQGIAHQVVSQASYNFGCFALDFEYRRFALGALRQEHQFRIALSLANVGSFGNLKPRERLY